MQGTSVRLRRGGVFTLPAHIRAKYGLREGDILTVLELDGVIVLRRDRPTLSELTTEVEQMRRGAGLHLSDLTRSLPGYRGSRAAARQKRGRCV